MNGLLVLDKPSGMTSHDVVYAVRRATGEKSVGHLGTLDPMATGVLPLLLGKWTRLAQFFSAAEKVYTGTIRFCWATDTYDAEGTQAGEIVPLTLGLAELQKLALHFAGEMEQMPPVFSAKKIGGVPAYKLARAGKEVPVKPARIFIHSFVLTGLEDDVASFEMHVSAGGYVRSVAHELGQMAGCGAHLASLRRTRAGDFSLEQSLTLDAMSALAGRGELEAALPHPRTLLQQLPCVTADEAAAGRLRNGMSVNLPEFSQSPLVKIFTGPRDLVGVGKRVAGTLVQPFVNLA
ncbi:tRNA pseudouridine(55) synthase TruB [Terriglobus saanensis]|uniref:tRNA pseudouridine synthase B n=1 Tax=Terriglobus saanensis (strain ATCC BAA-1853 / DSM 23119 / SP1PR4) TaxID=401053 RepID=E8UX11_TERSS|nr:tRNA pseudouridine synthase B [Terriglobus saanensis SP1PR4]